MDKEIYCSSFGYAIKGQIGNMKHESFTINPNIIEIGSCKIQATAAGENHTIFTDEVSVYG